ncbi:MAG TPA: hypothetical protein VK899_09020 [Gemmatimonadales bacterium]|nr:hypothetical protein [Gemmatimonadales bacterium]
MPPKEGSYHLHPELAHDYGSAESPEVENLGVETAEEVELQSSGASEFRVPNAAEDFMDAGAATPAAPGWPEVEMSSPPAFEIPAAAEGSPEPEKSAPAAESPPAPSPMPAPEPASVQEPSPQSYSVRETKGQSVVAFFQSLLSARPTGSPASSAGGSTGAGQDKPPAAAGAIAAASAPPNAGSADNVSFDDFFNAATSGSSPGNKEGDPSKDDLDQFQSWLQNLKR